LAKVILTEFFTKKVTNGRVRRACPALVGTRGIICRDGFVGAGKKKVQVSMSLYFLKIVLGFLFLIQRNIIIIEDTIYKWSVIKPEESSGIVGFIGIENFLKFLNTFKSGRIEWYIVSCKIT